MSLWPPSEPASPESGLARKHDETYKLIFSQRAAVEELIRNFVGEGLADELDPTPENLRRVLRGLIRRFRGPEFAELQQALYSWVAGAAEAWQIPEADLARMMSFTEDEEMYERAKELRDQVHRDGVRQGLEQGRIRERALVVRRFATRKFGAETAERLTEILEDMADADRIDEVVDAILDCDSGAELFARVRA